MLKLFVTCPAGLESLVLDEVKDLGATEVKETITGVFCWATQETMYKICLWSRFANRVLLVLAESQSGGRDELYSAAADIAWEEHMEGSDTLRVDFAGTNDEIRHTQFGARVIKDAIVDRMKQRVDIRPNVDLAQPDHRINVRLTKKSIYIGLDVSGESLHKRGYRTGKGLAPIKENLAAGLLARAKWPEMAKAGAGFVDPMCGSATFLIEAAFMAANIAPGLTRKHFGFFNWQKHDDLMWQSIVADARIAKEQGLEKILSTILGCERENTISEQARRNVRNAGVGSIVKIEVDDFRNVSFAGVGDTGLVLSNPPYGMRIGEVDKLGLEYFELAEACKEKFLGWQLGIVSSNPSLLSQTRLRADKKYKIFNGAIPCELRLYSLKTQEQIVAHEKQHADKPKRAYTDESALSEGAIMVANRLKKNIKKLKNWKKKNNIACFRVYDADLPEYAAAIDLYGEMLHVQEYDPPKSIDPTKAKTRFDEIIQAICYVFGVDRNEISIKTRRVNRGLTQYEKQSELDEGAFVEVKEGSATFLVNLKSYLDTGLFLDHRLLRLRIGEMAAGKRFLNLFSYTSTATVHAVLGGAIESTSVDMSNTYTRWSKLNMEKNNIQSARHELVRADVLKWLHECRKGYDLIMLDPPSFSNSKKMDASFDVQRDHTELIERCMDVLTPKGILFFSNNLRRFKIDESLYQKYKIAVITRDTIDLDFQRNTKIHHCFQIEQQEP